MNLMGLKLQYSRQSLLLLKQFENFNEEDFKRWYDKQPIGSEWILDYILTKNND